MEMYCFTYLCWVGIAHISFKLLVQVRKLIEEGAKVEFWNDQLQTPLLVASEKGRLNTLLALVYSFPLRPLKNIFSLILRHAAPCCALSHFLDGFVAPAFFCLHLPIGMKRGSLVFAVSIPAHICDSLADPYTVKQVECGANMHHTDNKKSNALHYAAYNGHCDTIKSLVFNCACVLLGCELPSSQPLGARRQGA